MMIDTYADAKAKTEIALNRTLSPKETAEERWATPGSASWLQVSTMGRVRSAKSGRIRKIGCRRNQYGCVDNRLVHRLVAEAFMPSFSAAAREGLEIDHYNGRRTDNRLANLQLVTHIANVRKSCGRTIQIGNTIYPSITSVAETYGCSPRSVYSYLARGSMPDGEAVADTATYTNGVVYSL